MSEALLATNNLAFPALSLLVWLPLIGAILVAMVPERQAGLAHAFGILTAGLTACLALVLFGAFERELAGFQFVDGLAARAWLPGGVTYQVGVDGVGLVLLLLTALLTLLALMFSWGSVTVRVREYVVLMLVLETGMLGVFSALDLFLFYVFWELTLIPMVLLIGVWGGAGRIYASVKFVLYTLAGSALMLVAIVALASATGSPTFRLIDLVTRPPLETGVQWLFFGAFALAFAVKVPLFPLHTWLPDAHVEAPTAGSVILAGVLLKMGIYGFFRFAMPLFPVAAVEAAPLMAGLAVAGIIYGAWVAYAQDDMKSLVAYSSVSHMGVVIVGMFAINSVGMTGGLLQMVNHGITTGALFLLVGMLYDRAHTRRIADFGGLWATMPRYSAAFLVVTCASIGLPGLNGFVGEWLSLVGAFRANPLVGAAAATGVILGAAYMLWLVQRILFGAPAGQGAAGLPDLTGREMAVLAPLVGLMVWLGVAPGVVLGPLSDAVGRWMVLISRGAMLAGG